MRKIISTIILTLALMVPSIVEAYTTIDTDGRIRINMVCQKIDVSKSAEDIHRTPPRILVVYFDSTTSILYFETPCYDCTLELVIPGTDTIVYYIFRSIPVQHSGAAVSSQKGQK